MSFVFVILWKVKAHLTTKVERQSLIQKRHSDFRPKNAMATHIITFFFFILLFLFEKRNIAMYNVMWRIKKKEDTGYTWYTTWYLYYQSPCDRALFGASPMGRVHPTTFSPRNNNLAIHPSLWCTTYFLLFTSSVIDETLFCSTATHVVHKLQKQEASLTHWYNKRWEQVKEL